VTAKPPIALLLVLALAGGGWALAVHDQTSKAVPFELP